MADPEQAVALPDSIVVSPGRYRFKIGDRLIAISALHDGLYQVSYPGKGTRQFVVWRRRNGVETLLRNLTGLYSHGTRDDRATTELLLELVRTRPLSATCGSVVNLLVEVLRQLGVPSRRVLTTTLETFNGYDDGHVLLEIRFGGRWHLYDPDLGVRFVSGAQSLSAYDIASGQRARFNSSIRFYAPERQMAIDSGSLVASDGFDFTFMEVRSRLSYTSIERWYQRVLGLIAREIDGVSYYAASTNGERQRALIAQPGAQFVSLTEFRDL